MRNSKFFLSHSNLCTVTPAPLKLRAKTTYSHCAADTDDISDEIGDNFIVPEVSDENEDCDDELQSDYLGTAESNSLIFNPIYTLSVWKDPSSKDQRISIAILLPTGIGESPGDPKLSVESEKILKISVMWPSAMSSVPQLMRRWLTGQDGPEMKDYHLHVQGFYSFMEKFQSKEGDPIYSTAKIGLQIFDETRF